MALYEPSQEYNPDVKRLLATEFQWVKLEGEERVENMTNIAPIVVGNNQATA
jgi:hypothetical protein